MSAAFAPGEQIHTLGYDKLENGGTAPGVSSVQAIAKVCARVETDRYTAPALSAASPPCGHGPPSHRDSA